MEPPSGQDERPSGGPPDAPPEPSLLTDPAKRRQLIHIIVLDVIILAELAVALYVADAKRGQWDFTLTFCAVFFGLLIPTFLASRWLMGGKKGTS